MARSDSVRIGNSRLDNHTAFGLELVNPLPGVLATYRINVYDKMDQVLGTVTLTLPDQQKIFLGVQAKNTTIGRIDIYETNNFAAAISRITAWPLPDKNPFGCPQPGDCCVPHPTPARDRGSCSRRSTRPPSREAGL